VVMDDLIVINYRVVKMHEPSKDHVQGKDHEQDDLELNREDGLGAFREPDREKNDPKGHQPPEPVEELPVNKLDKNGDQDYQFHEPG